MIIIWKLLIKNYNATKGLMELLLKKSPNSIHVTDEDIKCYKQILDDSNAIYQGFDSTQKRLNSDASNKWKFIKEQIFNKKRWINYLTFRCELFDQSIEIISSFFQTRK